MDDKEAKKSHRIGIDARFYGPVGKGLGRYTQELVDNLVRLDQDNRYVIFLRQENFSAFSCDGVRVKKVLADVRWYTLAEQLIMPYLVWREKIDLMHFPHFNVPLFTPAKFVVTIHDLILLNYPTDRATTLGPFLYKIKNFAYRLVIGHAVKASEKIIAVSAFTKDDIARHFKTGEEKIAVTYEGVSALSREGETVPAPQAAATLGKYGAKPPFLLYVGNAYPHKNLEGLLKVFAKLSGEKTELSLVLVGREDYFYQRLKRQAAGLGLAREGEQSRLVFAGYVPDPELKILYQNALAYVFPSFYEGFGLPPLEAMAAGLPVASSNRTSLPEVLGEAAAFFDPTDESEMLAQIKKITEDENLRLKLIETGRLQAKRYDWQTCALKTLEIYKQVISYKL